ncbi:TetR/AcrR family transcriptional regulator [Mycobacteroides abscessus]|uniref:TetR family transcriptional regulator n=3 Tax=Mycobacteroides abscessus TaxID=36809 RepID=A0A829HZ73_9MYCO|nr:TetR/AcrR family transcriptional regulator [Mycobacteroides abscessus]AFN62970.1 TetR family transcriptional regulator [Mycobacteroides abscessus subsp. massiliense str. GO 06]AMU25316.1 TetR family transcriptional regulator [Mycobacteroides abscessus]AMU35042.1 TetR family transcriptional regulator [Mycobacteroides abscessus]AMU40045.1 TetR family transcriptional regulator [Mycobacteroides abscessus]AMU60032.1 TetR family transcriptional regulator [Mycobacteroides abscessus]
MSTPRERMVASAALLIRERGAHATAISDVLEHSGAPRGSAYHYFPGGRTQLLSEAVDLAGEYIAEMIDTKPSAVDALDVLVASYRKQLVRSDFRAGCPVVAVAVEAGDPESPASSQKLIEHSAAVFRRWIDLIADKLVAVGVARTRADELAMLMTTSLEGAIIIARSTRDITPIDVVHRQLRTLIEEAGQ